MMQRFLLVLLCLFTFSFSFCQSLAGKWEGWFTFKNDTKDTAIIKLYFKLNEDSTYEVHSFTKFGDFKAECKMSYRMINNHFIYLEEKELVRSNNSSGDIMFQKMRLNIESSSTLMKGKWFYKDGRLKYSGDVVFAKKT